jgi:quinoprotein relay system zinc metallohydrolase 2
MQFINRWVYTCFAIATVLMQIVQAAQAEPLSVTKVADGLYVHQGVHEDLSEGYHGDICNISFVIGSKGVAVIDTGGSFKTGQALHEAIRKITPLPILYVINTHVHPDHIFGNAAFLEDKPVFVGHAKLADAMTLRTDAYMRMNQTWMGDAFAGSEIVKPTLAVQDTLTLDIGDRKLILTAYPKAHTNTDITVLDSKTATLWTGDLLFIERTPSVDGDIKGWLAVISQLKELKVNAVVPGHGTPTKDWQAALDKEQHYLDILLTDIRASIKKGEVMEKTMDTAAASEKNHWVLFDIVNRRNVNNLYPALEWE